MHLHLFSSISSPLLSLKRAVLFTSSSNTVGPSSCSSCFEASDMLGAFVYALVSLYPFFHRLSAAAHPSGHEDSPWFMGCVNDSNRLYAAKGGRDLDPVTCCARCLDEGYQVAALTSEGCYCDNRQHGLVARECFNTSSKGGTKDARGESERQSMPAGGGPGSVALYRTEGPFLHSVRLSTSPDRVQAGKAFVVEVSGNLAGRPSQPTGILGLRGQDLSHVTVEFQETTPRGQSSHRVNLLDDGSFVVSSDWILETPGKYELNVSVSNPLSTLSSTLQLSVLHHSTDSLMISVLHGPLGVPSCIPFLQTGSKSEAVEAAYLGDPVTLQAYTADGPPLEFIWWFAHKGKEKNTEGVKTACLPNSGCLNSTVNWTFETEGVHMVSVNASSAFGWTQETIYVAIVRLAVSDLRVSAPGDPLMAGEGISVDVELFTTMKHLLALDLSLNAEVSNIGMRDNLSNTDGGDFSSDNKNISDKAENHSSKNSHQENSKDHNCSSNYQLNQNHQNIYFHGATHLYVDSDAHHFTSLHLLHTSKRSSCHLHLHLHCRLPTTAGQYRLTSSVLSNSDPSSVLLSTVLPRPLMVYEHICALRPSGSWKSVVSTRSELSLEVVSPANRMGSKVIWTFSLDSVIVMSRTTEEWNVNVSLAVAGRYKVTVKAFNPISWASFCTHILAQDPVGGLVLNVPSVITAHQMYPVLFSVTAGSNVTVSLLANATLLYRNSSYTTGEEATVVLLLNHTRTVAVELRAENQVSSQNKSLRVCFDRNRMLLPQVRANATWQPPTSQSPVHSLADNVRIYATKQAYPTNTDITFLAVAEVPDPVEFLWHFGDSRSARTTLRTVTKRYQKPGRYDVVVVAMPVGRASLTSDVFSLVVQRAVKLNRLLHQASVLPNQTVVVSCWVNVGTDISFLWSFGDGSSRPGQSTEQHVFHRTGEFRVQVTASNLVSSASLSSHIFVVDRPCQPPPVKNMGPLRLQVRRNEVIHLAVTYETEVDCDVSGGLDYTWTLFDSAGQVFPLPLIATHRQNLVLPSHLLHYDTYTAIARVQVVGSVVYSNYSVRVQVIPSPPVALIQGGTNIFIKNRNTTVVTLDGQRSYDPDFPMNPVSFSWTCKPVSSITTSCFHHDIPTSSPVLVFPASFLKRNFDQFRFTLTIHSGERSASSETFRTLTSNVIRMVSVYCPQCQGDQVNWDQSFSVSALCEGCDISPKYTQYTWSLYLVNVSSKPVIEVPFCYTVHLGAPSTIVEGPATSLHPPATDASQHTHPVNNSLIKNASETTAKKLNLNVTDSGTLSKNNRKKSAVSGLTEPELSAFSSLVNTRTAGSGEEPFYLTLGEFDPPEPLYSYTEYQTLALDNSGVLYSDHFGKSDVISELPIDSDSSADWDFSFPVLESDDYGGRPAEYITDSVYDVPLMSAEEGDPGISAGRPTDVDGESLTPGDDSAFHPALHEDEGSNLVDSRPSVMIQEPILLDLTRDPVDRGLFESYTYTGISSPLLSFRPFSLRPGSRYMLEVTAKSRDSFLGRTQLFLKTNPAPKGMTCQVQPIEGMELYTHFSIFCTSGKEDLLYEYSMSVGDRPPRMLYQGRDFQYYFSLPSGDPSDDYKVTIYTEIRSSTYGTATKPCPVTVQVQPSFLRDTTSSSSSSHLDPDLELSESGLRNLSALVRLGNSVEIRNYISLLSSILNRLSLDADANTHAQRRTRNVLICTVCKLGSSEHASMLDNIFILRNLLQVTSQVTLASARRVTVHVQVISEQLSKPSSAVWNDQDQETLTTLVTLLSHSLQAAVTNNGFTPEMSNSADITQALGSDSHDGNFRNAIAPSSGCIPDSSSGVYIQRGRSISTKQTVQLVADILQTASDLMLKYLLFHRTHEHRVSTDLISLYATYQNQTSGVVSSGLTAFYMPASLIQLLFGRRSRETGRRRHQPCVLCMLTELTHSPYTWAHYPGRLSGPVVHLSLYKCSTRRKIPVPSLVTLASARRVTVHVQVISEQLSKPSSAVWNDQDQETLTTLVTLLSHSLQAAVTNNGFTPEMSNSADITQALGSDSHDGNFRNAIAPSSGCIPDSSSGVYIQRGRSISTKQTVQLVADILQTASDLMLKYLLFHRTHEHRVSTDLISLYATYQNQTSGVVSSGLTAFYMPASLIQLLFGRRSRETGRRRHQPCVLCMLTELTHSPYTWAHYPGRLSGPVVHLSLYKCSTRRKIPVPSLVHPINIELQQPPRNQKSSVHEYVLLRSQVNYHSFNITQEHLQQAIQLSISFTPPLNKAFPIMLLFRMFVRPTPSMHHLRRIHRWESNTTRFTLPPPYLSAAGVGHLALLNADFGKATRHKHLSEQVSYSLSVDSSLCLSWDDHPGAWTDHGCRTRQADSTTTVNCSCHQLRPLTVVQQQIQSSHDTTNLDPFLSVSSDLTVLAVLVLCVCLYFVGLAVCKRADVVYKANRRVHYLSDNSPCDPYLYAVTIHTGLCSAACMSAKVYVVLNGEDGVSQTRELKVPRCTLFRRNSQDTFIFSAADSLGPVWGVHIWHDNSGPSPNLYLKQVEVSEVNRGHVKGRAWLFVAQCWLAMNKGDGRVERMLRVCTQGMGFAKMLRLKLSDYLADHHIWISVHSCPCPNSFTRTQRLSMSLLLLLGYACVNTVIISQMDDQLPFELGFIDVSPVSVTTGVLSVVAVLPAAAIISFLFRLRKVKRTGSGVQHAKGRKTEKYFVEDALSVSDGIFEPHLSWSGLQHWVQEAWRKKYQGTDLPPASAANLANKNTDKEPGIQTDVVIRKEDALVLENNTGPARQNLLPITEGNNVESAPQGKECYLLSESSGFHGTQSALLSGARDGGHAIQKENHPRRKRKEGSHHQAAWSGHSSCYHIVSGLKGRGPVSQWCHCLAWTLCLLSSLSCLVLSAVLGMRFSSSKVLLWIHSLFFSLMSCIFFIQPAVIFTVAVAVSFWYRKRADFHSFSSIREFEIETSHLLSHNCDKQQEEKSGTSAFPQERCSYIEKLLGARQRARYLRLVRPPAPSELRKTRGKERRQALLRHTLRDLSVCGSMLFLMLCINYGSSFTDHYRLNKAVRKQFIWGHDNAFMSIQKQEDWWKWAQTILPNLLYKNVSATTESRILIGKPILWQTEVSSSLQGQLSSVTLVPECLRLFLSGSQTSTYPQSSATIGLGHTKSDAASKLKLLHSGGWLGRQTLAVKVHFTLFSPAPNLFTSVTLLAEQSPTGVLLPSAKVQSVRVYHTPAVWDYVVMVCQLLFLLLSLLQLCDQLYTVGQQGLMGYWRKPGNWLEVSLLTVTLVYYVYYIYHSGMILEVVELLQRPNYKGHVDVSLLATWEQDIRTLRSVTLFLLTMKCVTALKVNRTMATSATLLARSLSSLFWPTFTCLILVVALSCMGNLLFVQSSGAFSSLSRSLQTLLCHCWGLRAVRGLLLPGRDFLYGGILCLSSTMVWTVLAIGVVSSLVRSAKRSQSRGNVFTLAELVSYIRHQMISGQHREARIENHGEGKTYYLEEFESLVDELLFRLNALSDSLHHTLPPKAHRYREDSPVSSPIQEPSDMDAQDFVKSQVTEETETVTGCGETLPASHLLRSALDREILQFLQQQSQKSDHSPSDMASDNSQQPGTRAEENPNDKELQTYLKAQNYLPLPESASLINVWTEDVLEEQVDQWTKTNDSSWLRKIQANHTEVVVVEVLVHEEPGSVETMSF
ncbi:polycystic kidney disease 1 like 1 [Micropterus dolomieu]|uniref:polycystic kidney disease 1 like 1 n=1 Tax=Micropterus dolomieu TaxID=147949 RepID=UPI001E8D6B17|nr:polycystic kidney disease 1 like 1 [Micropterus dolomieu]